jgi:cell division protease FtsH
MVKQYGMSDKLGHMTFEQERKPLFLDLPGTGTREYSEETAREIDNEVSSIVENVYTKVKTTLDGKKDMLIFVAKTLLEKETIEGEDLRKMLKEYAEGNDGNQS